MRLEQLKYFISIAKTQSINKTSLEFYTTHQGVSKALRQLEDEMGAPLFERSPKGMLLTAEGEMLLPVAERCVNDLHSVQLKISHKHRNENMEGKLKLWGTPATNAIIVPALLDDFGTLYSRVRYQIKEANTLDILRNVALHPAELGIVVMLHDPAFSDFYEPYIQRVRLHPLQQDEYICLASVHSPLTDRKTISFEEFANHPITTLLSDTDANDNNPIIQLLRRLADVEPAFSSSSLQLVKQAIASGKYVGISSRRSRTEARQFDDGDVVAIPFEEDLSLDIMLVTNLLPALDDISQAFVDLVREQAKGI